MRHRVVSKRNETETPPALDGIRQEVFPVRQSNRKSPPLKHAINVTPLADVMLVLLIIFMVVTPLITTGVDVPVPEAEHPTKHPDSDQIPVVSLQSDGRVFLNRDLVAEGSLLPALSTVMSERREKVLYLKAGEQLDYGFVLEMMDLCRRAGADEVALITKDRPKPAAP